MFSDSTHITVKKIKDKAGNMKRAWQAASAKQEASGWGIKSEDNDDFISEAQERKRPWFWRLDDLWGSRPNVTVILDINHWHHRPIDPKIYLSQQNVSNL